MAVADLIISLHLLKSLNYTEGSFACTLERSEKKKTRQMSEFRGAVLLTGLQDILKWCLVQNVSLKGNRN